MTSIHKKHLLKTGIKFMIYILISIVILIAILFFYLNTKSGKQFLKKQATSFLTKKLNTKLSIESIDFRLPNYFELNQVMIEDQQHDSLFYGEQLTVNLALFKLIQGETDIKKIALSNAAIHIERTENDSVFNYQFVIDAFAGNKTPQTVKDTAALKLMLRQVNLNQVTLKFNDQYAGSNMYAFIQTLDVKLNTFQTDRFIFGIDNLQAKGIRFTMLTSENKHLQPKTTTSGNPLILTAKNIQIQDVRTDIENQVNGFSNHNYIQDLNIKKLDFNLLNENIEIEDLLMSQSKIQVATTSQKEKPLETDSNKASNWLVKINKITLDSNTISYDKKDQAQSNDFNPNHLTLSPLTLHANNLYYTADSISTMINQLNVHDRSGLSIDTLHALLVYTKQQMSATELFLKTPQSELKNALHISFDSIQSITTHPENTSIQIKLNESRIAMNELFKWVPVLKKKINASAFYNQSLRINTLITGTLEKINIPILQLTGLDGSAINARATLYHVTNAKKMMLDITLLSSNISKRDIAKFVKLSPAAFAQLPAMLHLKATAVGSLNQMQTDIYLVGTQLLLDAKASLKNLNNMKLFTYDVNIRKSHFQKNLLLSFIPKEKIPTSIELPQDIILSGTLKGDANNILTNLKLDGSYGVATIKGYVNHFTNKEKASYDLHMTTQTFKIGKLLKKDSLLSTVTMQAAIKGRGFNPKSMQSQIVTEINAIGFKNYDYKNISIEADADQGFIKSNGRVNDPNLTLQYHGTTTLNGPSPAAEVWLHLDTARLHALQLSKDTINIAMNSHLKADNLTLDQLNATLQIDSLKLKINQQQMFIDSVHAVALSKEGKKEISFYSPMAELYANGNFQYDKIIPSIMRYINNYYPINDDSSIVVSSPQNISLNGLIREHPLIKSFIKGLSKYETITFNGAYASQATDSALQFNLLLPSALYQGNQLYNGHIEVSAANEQMRYAITADTVHTIDTKLYGSSLTGYLAHDSLIVDAVTKDANGNKRYLLGVTASVKDKEYRFRLKDNLLLNFKPWTIDPANEVYYAPAGIHVNHFNLAYKQSGLAIQSETPQPNSPINININQFLISDITSLLNKDTLLAKGIINGKVKISEFDKVMPSFVGDITMDSLYYKNQAIGNLGIHTQKENENTISGNVSLTGNENNVTLKGNYYLNNLDKQFDADLNIVHFNIASLQGFSNGNISNAQGGIDGKLALNGKFANPEWMGSIHTKNTTFRLPKFGTVYTINNQYIAFDYPMITLKQFTIKDSADNALKIDGQLKANSFTSYGLNLKLDSKDFIVVHTEKATNDLIYGYAAINTDVNITGSTSAPNIQGALSLNDFSDATLVLPEKNVNKDAARSVVRFIDKDTFELPEKILFVTAAPEKPSITTFLNYNLNITLSPKASLTVIIDPSTGDELKVKGDAKLNVGVDPGGNILLAGNFDLHEGHYMLHYQFLARKFNLLSGSTIAFGGAPLDAQVNIQAEYIANTNAIDLVGNELGDVDNKTVNTFNQKIPFRVLLFIKGTLSKLQISFDIQLPNENNGISNVIVTTVENKLTQLRNDPAAINKQVFSLLVLNRFVGEQSNDFFKGNGDGLSDMARQSVSKFLSAALDQIASDLIKGVDIDLNLNSYKDYSTGDEQQRTDLNIGVSKRFMDDRLSISVGKNLGIEGQDKSAKARQQNTASYMPDATVSYKLTKDGRYMLRAYSKNKFEVILDGYIVETGLSFIVSMDYEKFNELFKKKKKK
jgi:hypothetical protein